MKIFENVLMVGWAAFLGIVGLYFIIPKLMSHVLAPIADFFALVPVSLLIGTGLYGTMHLYHAGM